MEESTATILTSHFEGFSLVILESMLNSTPIISYDINYGPNELIEHGVDGFLVKEYNIKKMAKYIIELLDNTEKAKKMGISARKKVLENYTEDMVSDKWEKLLNTISLKKSRTWIDSQEEVKIEKNLENILNENKSIIQKYFQNFLVCTS